MGQSLDCLAAVIALCGSRVEKLKISKFWDYCHGKWHKHEFILISVGRKTKHNFTNVKKTSLILEENITWKCQLRSSSVRYRVSLVTFKRTTDYLFAHLDIVRKKCTLIRFRNCLIGTAYRSVACLTKGHLQMVQYTVFASLQILNFQQKIGFGFCSLDLHIPAKKLKNVEREYFLSFLNRPFYQNY